MNGLLAVLRRDARGAERAGLLNAARAVSLAGAGLFAVTAYLSFGPGSARDIPPTVALLVGGLMLLSLVHAAAFALGAFRAERQAGTLDLLLLAGLTPRSLALGRILSSFLMLQTIAAAASPALVLFWFFRTPSPHDWLLHAIALTSWNAVMAAGGVAISAWSLRPGTALAGGLTLLPAFAAFSLTEGARLTWSAPGLVHRLSLGESGLDLTRGFLCLGFHAAFVVVALLLAEQGLRRRRPDALLTAPPNTVRRYTPSERRPMTWLLHRTSVASRPRVQALAIAAGLACLLTGSAAARLVDGSLSELADPQALSALGGTIGLLALGAALAAGATRIAAERERRTWDTIAASSRTSEALFSDLIVSTLLCCIVPFLIGAGLLAAAELQRGTGPLVALLPGLSLLATLFLASVLGLAASACARGSAGALALGCLLALGVPALVAATQLLAAEGVLQGGLVLLAIILVLALPILVRGVGPFFLLAVSALRAGSRHAKGPARLITRPLLVLLPLAFVTGALIDRSEPAWALAYGGGHAALMHVATLGEERSLIAPQILVSGALWQSLFALLMLNGLWTRRELWLGRAAT